MFKGLISFILVFSFQWVQARSLMPRCAPVVDAMPSRLSCGKDMVVKWASGKEEVTRVFYTVIINTKMSQASCIGNDHQELRRATITVSTVGSDIATIELRPGTFEYSLGFGDEKGNLSAPILGLELNDCVSPVHGGFSIGN